MPTYLSVSDVARLLGAKPRVISDLFYRRELPDGRCPIIGGRRLIPEDCIDEIAAALARRCRRISRMGGLR